MAVLLFPGQGAQTPGLLAPWLDLPGARETLVGWSDLAGIDLVAAGTVWSVEAIRDTSVAQPLLTAVALLSARALLRDQLPGAVCGHSVGELPALAIAGVIADGTALELAALRGRAMARAAQEAPSGMAAVLGGDPGLVQAQADELGLEVATVNVAGQVVLGGPGAALQRLLTSPPAGARVRLLDVAGAFHTRAMGSAGPAFQAALDATPARPPALTLVANRDGAVVTDGREALDRLAGQLTSTVRFDLCLATIGNLSPAAVIELAPGGTLAALAKRALPGVPVVAVRTPEDLAEAQSYLAVAGESLPVAWRALPSPSTGVVDQIRLTGASVAAGDTVAIVVGRSGASSVTAPCAGVVTEWLVSPGDPVRPGQLLAVLG